VAGEKLYSLSGGECKIEIVDVTSLASIQKFTRSIGDQPIDMLLNIAGQPLLSSVGNSMC